MQNPSFNDAQGIRIAAEMERRGEAFYRKAARISKNPETAKTFELLASEEALHRVEFERLAGQVKEDSGDYDPEVSAYLSAVAADIVFSDGLMALRSAGFDSPAGALQEAIQSEKDSILFYTELSENAFDPAARKVFEEIIRQEKGHLRTLQLRLNALASEG